MDRTSSGDREAKLISGMRLERASSSMSSESVIWRGTGSGSAALDLVRVMTLAHSPWGIVSDNGAAATCC